MNYANHTMEGLKELHLSTSMQLTIAKERIIMLEKERQEIESAIRDKLKKEIGGYDA